MTTKSTIEPGTADQQIPSISVPEPLATKAGRPATSSILSMTLRKIGRASCRERVFRAV